MTTEPREDLPRVLIVSPYGSPAAGVRVFTTTLESELRVRGYRARAETPADARAPPGMRNLELAIASAGALFRRRSDFDIVHCQQAHLQSVACGILGRVLGKGVVLTIHGRSPRARGLLRGIVSAAVESLALWCADRIVFVAASLRKPRQEGTVIPNGVEMSSIRAQVAAREAVRSELGLGDSFVFAYLGRISTDKGFLLLLDALARIRDRVSRKVRLVAVGPIEDEVRDEIDRRFTEVSSLVLLLGFQSRPLRFVASADVFVLPSLREGLPLSLLEAMGAGLPAIASSVGDIPHVVRPGLTGWLVAPGDLSSLTEALLQAVSNPARCAEMGERAAISISSDFSADRMIKAYARIYGEVSSP